MTTLEIAELTGKAHRNVMRDARAMLIELHGENSLLRFEESRTNERGRTFMAYRLPKREVLILMAGYSIALRARIVDRLAELERTDHSEAQAGR